MKTPGHGFGGALVSGLALVSVAGAAWTGEPWLAIVVLGAWAFGLGLVVVGRRWDVARGLPRPSPAHSSPRRAADPQVPNLRRLAMWAVGLRLVCGLIFNLTGFNMAVAPDSVAYSYFGRLIAKSWEDPSFGLEGTVGYSAQSLYQHLNALVWFGLGFDSAHVLSAINAFLGVGCAWLVSRLALGLYGAAAARRAFILAAFYPSLVLWTSINLRDAWSFGLMLAALLCAQSLRESFSLSKLVLLVGCFAVMPFVRGYLVPIIGAGILASYFVVRVRRLPAAMLSLAALLAFLVFLADYFGVSLSVDLEDRLQSIERMRNGLAYGDSAFDTSMSIATPGAALLYLPVGIVNFLFSPLPWRVDSWRQAMALPETLLTYWVMFAAIRQGARSIKERTGDVAVLLFVAAAITCSYSLVEGNEGTAFRHRGHVLLLVFVFAAGGMVGTRRSLRAEGGDPGATGLALAQR